jgi:DNA replication and repair protein RecF
MKVEKLTLRNFRNIKDATFFPETNVNFLVGANGQGKTSFIEALGFLSTLRSFRESKTPNVIQWGTTRSEISCSLSSHSEISGEWRTHLRVAFQNTDETAQKASKIAFVNEKAFRSSTQYLSQRFGSYELGFHTVIFNPSDHDLVRGDPATRRAYLDRVIAAEDVEYLRTLQKYQRVLAQRNSLLKSSENISSDVLMGFTDPLCRFGSYLTLKRLQWIGRVSATLIKTLSRIAPSQSVPRIAYLSNWAPHIENLSFNNNNLHSVHFTGQGSLPSLELLEQTFWIKVSLLESAERRAGHSLVGPHRDDWAFFLGDQVLKGHGSQGEVRSTLLALKLSEIELFRNETGHRPLFLLDDFSSELDRERRLFLLRFLMETDLQTFVTTTEDTSFVGKRFWVGNGVIEKENDDRTNTGKFE